MALTAQQLSALKADIAGDPALNSQPMTSAGAAAIAVAYNQIAAPDFMVWRTNVDPQEVFDQINWSLYTPADAVDSSTLQTNRLLAIQTKQMNLQNITVGRGSLNFAKANVRAGIRDAVIAVPAGANGASVSPGGASGATVLGVCVRKATRAEKLFNTGSATTGTTQASIMGFEGALSSDDVQQARELP